MKIAGLMAALSIAASACGGSNAGAPSPVTMALPHGEVSDPAGDSPSDPRVSVTSDLVRATADVAGGNITFVIQLAPGTLDRQLTRVIILLDTDQSGTTGLRQLDGMGADYAIELLGSQATLSRANPLNCAASQGCFDAFRTDPVGAIADGMQLTVPLSALGSSDGRMTFSLHSYVTVVIGSTLTPIPFDWMPDERLPPGRIQ